MGKRKRDSRGRFIKSEPTEEEKRLAMVLIYYAVHDITQEYSDYGHLQPGCSLYRDGDLGNVPRMRPRGDKEFHELRVRLGILKED